MTIPTQALEQECLALTQYLLGCPPNSYVVQKYVDAHHAVQALGYGSSFDRFLVRCARQHWLLTKLADSYARIFDSQGLLRKKLVLLLAILETSPPFFQAIDAVDGGSKLWLTVRLICRGSMAVISLVAGALVFFPIQLVMAKSESQRK